MSDPSETRTASSTGGEKGVKLARYDLLPVNPLEEVASRFGLGAMKYDHRNWERGYEWSKSYGAAQRHLNAFWRGEDDDDLGDEAYRACGLDPEDFKVDGRIPGSSHLAAAAAHILFLLEWQATHPEFDDRVKPRVIPISDHKMHVRVDPHAKAAQWLAADVDLGLSEIEKHFFTVHPTGVVTRNSDGAIVYDPTVDGTQEALQKALDRDQRGQ